MLFCVFSSLLLLSFFNFFFYSVLFYFIFYSVRFCLFPSHLFVGVCTQTASTEGGFVENIGPMEKGPVAVSVHGDLARGQGFCEYEGSADVRGVLITIIVLVLSATS